MGCRHYDRIRYYSIVRPWYQTTSVELLSGALRDLQVASEWIILPPACWDKEDAFVPKFNIAAVV